VPQSRRLRRIATAALTCVSLALGALALTPMAATAAVGDTQIAWVEVEDGVISGGPALNSGDHGNFSGSGSYTFRETGMTSSMTVTAPEAGTYPVWIRYAAGPLGGAEDVTRSMGLTTNGSRQVVSYPLTGSWESWAFASATVTLDQGANTIALNCQRNLPTEMCRLNLDAIQVGGLAADTCVPTAVPAGAARLFDGTFASFDQWRKAGGGGFGHQTDCTIRGFRGPGSTWTQATTSQQANPYTLVLDWKRGDADDASSVYVGSATSNVVNPTTGYRVMIGASDTATVTSADGAFTQAADAASLAAAVRPVNQWNRYAVQVTPARIRVLLNGTVVNAVDRAVPLGGYIGLENRSAAAQVDFRDIQVQPGVDLGPIAGPAKRATKANGTTPNPGGESTLAHLVADAQRWATRGTSGGTARIAFASPTALEADLVPAGASVTYAQAAAVLDAEPLVNMRLTGAQIKTVLEQQWQTTSGGEVPSPAFVRLGASSGLTWTHDVSRPQGDRITGTWLDGTALNPAGNYSVTVSQSLAAGGDNFREFTDGLVPQVRQATTVSALAAYLGDGSTTAPLAVPQSQRAVGVSVPGGAPSSYVAGTTYALDLSSWSYSNATDPRDTGVAVTIAGRPVGTIPVDATRTDNAFDEDGRVAVRATIPADLAAGTATVRIVGTTTGTTVTRTIAVTAAPPAPTPTPTPIPTPTPTPTPLPTPTPTTSKVKPTLKVKVKPGRVTAKETRARLVVTVASTGSTPTGKVTVRAAGRTYATRLRGGKATVTLRAFTAAGKAKVKVSYAGDAATLSAARTLKIAVLAP
jgi:hypothetical protein